MSAIIISPLRVHPLDRDKWSSTTWIRLLLESISSLNASKPMAPPGAPPPCGSETGVKGVGYGCQRKTICYVSSREVLLAQRVIWILILQSPFYYFSFSSSLLRTWWCEVATKTRAHRCESNCWKKWNSGFVNAQQETHPNTERGTPSTVGQRRTTKSNKRPEGMCMTARNMEIW